MATDLRPGEFFGARRTAFHAGHVVLTELEHRVGRALPEHTHEAASFCIVTAGAYREQFSGQELEYRRWSVGFHPAAFRHRDQIGRSGARFLMVELEKSWLDELCVHYRIELAPRLLQRVAEPLARRLYAAHRDGAQLAAEGLVLELLAETARLPEPADRALPPWMRTLDQILHARAAENVTLRELARELDLHPVYLGRAFRRLRGQSLGEYLMHLRLERACELLHSPKRTLAEVALEAGFSDQSHLTRVFRRLRGTTPAAYRRRFLS